jgi:hypothetical protein
MPIDADDENVVRILRSRAMTKKPSGLFLAIIAFVLYIVGGLLFFGGVALITLMGGHDLFGWGEAKTVGYLCVCAGASLSIMGVLFLRLVRNRTDSLLSQSAKRPQRP